MPFTDFLLKSRCIACGRIDRQGLCPGCINQFQNLPERSCLICKSDKVNNNICLECKNRTPLFKSLTAIGIYNGLLKSLIYDFKYQGQKKFGIALGKLLAEKIAESTIIKEIDYISSIPLHKDKLKQRKYNQAEIVSVSLAKSIKKPYRSLLIRDRNTEAQHSLNLKQRKENLQNAFILNSGFKVKNKNILIVDDIFTSGSTVQEASEVLLKNGARDIYIAVLARSLS